MQEATDHPTWCGSETGGQRIMLVAGRASRISVVTACDLCGRRRALRVSFPVATSVGLADQLAMLASYLELVTGTPVDVGPPQDPPAGVREPRRPPPDAGSGHAGLPLPPPGD